MNKSKTRLMPLLLLTAGALTFTGCTNDKFDFDKIDATMGFGSESLEIPYSSTQEIPLEDILELQQDGSVKTDADGNYLFQMAGNEVEGANPKINPIVLSGISMPVTIDIATPTTYAKAKKAATNTSIDFTSDKEQIFQFTGQDKSIKDLTQATIDETNMRLTLSFDGIVSAISTLQSITLSLPGYLCIEDVSCNNGTCSLNGSKITVSNVSTAKQLVLGIKTKQLDFSKQDALGTLSINKNTGYISMDGFFTIGIKANITGVASSLQIKANIDVNNITLRKATGVFDPEIKINSLGEVDVTGIPDFLADDNVVADLDNPMIILNVANNMDAAAKVSATIVSTKNGIELARVQLPSMSISKSSIKEVTKICICRQKTNSLISQYGEDNIYEVSTLSSLIERIPDHISIKDVKAQADLSQTATIEFGKTYSVKPSYEIYAPLAFGKKANIVYTDTFTGWNDDVKDLDLAEGTYIEVTADAENKIPAYLTVSAFPIDAQGNEIKNKLTIETPDKVMPSTDGTTAVTTPITMKISANEKEALKDLDGLSFRVSGSASDGSSKSITGVTINAQKHSLKLNNIKVKIVGKIIGDFN